MSFGNMRRSAQQDSDDVAGCVTFFAYAFVAVMLVIFAVIALASTGVLPWLI